MAGSSGKAPSPGRGRALAAIDDRAAELTLVTVFEEDVEGYVIVRGPHTVDETGDAWTCDCTFTVVGADGTVLDSGSARPTRGDCRCKGWIWSVRR